MPSPNQLNALIIDSSPETRATLKGIFESEQEYKHSAYQSVLVENSIEDIPQILRKHKTTDVFFLSLGFALPKIETFIRTVKSEDKYSAKSFVLVCNASTDRDGAIIAQGIAAGADAFLLYPCSVVQLHEITKISQTIKVKAKERMIDESLRLLISRLMTEVKLKVEILYDAGKVTTYAKHLKDAAANLLQQDQEIWRRYFQLLDEKLADSKPRITVPKEHRPKSKLLQEKQRQRQLAAGKLVPEDNS